MPAHGSLLRRPASQRLRFTGSLAVVVPAFNEAPGITATLKALAEQHDLDFFLVVVDNASTDGTADVVRAFRQLHITVVHEAQKGTGAAADTGMRTAIAMGATHLARTDADCLPDPDWTDEIKSAFTDGLDLIAGQLLPRTDDQPVALWRRSLIRGVGELACLAGKLRPGNQDPAYLGPYVATAGCNMAITSDLYLRAGGFPRTAIEVLHEDRALLNAVRRISPAYGLRRSVRVRGSLRRVRAWGVWKSLLWYADHRYLPAHVDIR